MPGLTGIICFAPYEQIDQDLDSMLGAMRYNSRYSHGRFIDEECGLRMAWTSHPGSFAEDMPLVSQGGDTVMIFTGEGQSVTAGPLSLMQKYMPKAVRGPNAICVFALP